jgi:RNA polymerase sigma-70 factor (ECF subfamily)
MFEYEMTSAGTVNTDTQDIARGLRQRDVDFLRALVGQYQYRLVRYFIYLLGNRDPVDDLVQETWLHVIERGRSYDGRSRFEPWLFTVARNLAIVVSK